MSDSLTLLAVHAHPDDESIAMGGTLARYAAEGARTVLVCCTRGEEGEIHDPTLDPVHAAPRLGAIRERELRMAAAILGVGDADVRVLPYRDSGMAGTPANRRPDSFTNADPTEAAERVAAIIRATRPGVVVTYDPGGGYGHPDHKKAHRITLDAIARASRDGDGDGGPAWSVSKLYYTVVSLSTLLTVNTEMRARGLAAPFREDEHAFDIRQLAVPDAAITARVDVAGYTELTDRARRAHRTQLTDDDPLLALPPDLAARVFAVESYIRAFTLVSAPDREDDLFAGLR
jgi:N-acetyl-1-D-myo-inositol-2-amino-2-deoxy-alpha-D-glucopyranoside deacetylase